MNPFYLFRFDGWYKILSSDHFLNRDDSHKLIGETGWEIKWSDQNHGFILESSEEQYNWVKAIYNDTQEYPMGLRKWNILNDNCPKISKHYLLLTSCQKVAFINCVQYCVQYFVLPLKVAELQRSCRTISETKAVKSI